MMMPVSSSMPRPISSALRAMPMKRRCRLKCVSMTARNPSSPKPSPALVPQ